MVIDCKSVAAEIKTSIRKAISDNNLKLSLTIIKVGEDAASESYIKGKVKDCNEVGINTTVIRLPDSITEQELMELVDHYQSISSGIIVQLPLPKHIDTYKITQAISPDKDVDGFRKDSNFVPCTSAGIMRLLPEDLTGKDCLIINRSEIVGRPLVNLLLNRNATVTIAHSKTKNMRSKIKQADIIITAVGIPNFIKSYMLNSHQTIIDVAINRDSHGKLCGDLEKPQEEVEFAYTPVPGGVGLMTRAMLLYNVLLTCRNNGGLS